MNGIRRHTLLERVPDSLPSLGADSTIMAMMKFNCGLPATVSDGMGGQSSWTELDSLLSIYINAAERIIDESAGTTYRPRSYVYTVRDIRQAQILSLPSEITGRWYVLPVGRFSVLTLTRRPIAVTPVITWTDNDGNTGTFVEGTDFVFNGGRSLSPEITFLPATVNACPQVGLVPWPFKVTYSTVANDMNTETQQLAILQLASHYYRNPEAMGDSNPPSLGPGYDGLLTSLQGSFL